MRVIAGPEKKSRVMSEKERLVTAYHELGHAIVGHLLPNTDPVHKVSIISRGKALGYTISLPTEDFRPVHRAELLDTMAMTLEAAPRRRCLRRDHDRRVERPREGDRDGEQMVCASMSTPRLRLRPRPLAAVPGREFSAEPDYSDEIAREIDDEVRRIVEDAHQTSKDILGEHRAPSTIPRSCSSARRSRPRSSSRCSRASPRTRSSPTEARRPRPEAPPVEEKGTAREAPARARAPPGLAGGGAEMRAHDS